MTGTLILSGTYQWMTKVEDAPFGSREVRKLLIARGVGGFFGVYGVYCECDATFSACRSWPQQLQLLTRAQ